MGLRNDVYLSLDEEAFETFFYWINERQSIYLKKSLGEPKPWTEDEYFQKWKFCNVFRTQDRQTEFMMDNIIKPHMEESPALMLFNIYAFRAFNWYDTYESLCNVQSGWIHQWNPRRAMEVLNQRDTDAMKLTSGAYMIRGRQGLPKYESIVQTLSTIWNQKDSLLAEILDLDVINMQNVYHTLMLAHYWGWGPFTTYQIILDLTYTPILQGADDINTWCEFGPGAKRGLRCIFPGIKRSDMLEATRWLHSCARGPRNFMLKEHVPEMTLQDIEFSLCELSKYMRLKRGGKSKEKYDGR